MEKTDLVTVILLPVLWDVFGRALKMIQWMLLRMSSREHIRFNSAGHMRAKKDGIVWHRER